MKPPWPLWYVDLHIAWQVATTAVRWTITWALILPAAVLTGLVTAYAWIIPDCGPLEKWRELRRGRAVFLATGRIRGVPASPPNPPARTDEGDKDEQ